MQLELELLCDFEELCANAVGKVLSPNTIEVDDDGRHGHVATSCRKEARHSKH